MAESSVDNEFIAEVTVYNLHVAENVKMNEQ